MGGYAPYWLLPEHREEEKRRHEAVVSWINRTVLDVEEDPKFRADLVRSLRLYEAGKYEEANALLEKWGATEL